MEIVYIDVLFFLNLLTDYLLCLAAARLCGLYLKRRRYALAALLGALYAVSCVLPGLGFLASPPGKLAVGILLGWVAFGGEKQLLRCMLALLGVSAGFGGVLYALSLAGGGPEPLSVKNLLIGFPLCYGLLRLFSRFRTRRADSRSAQVELRFLGREARFTALLDSGNALSDPATGAGVLVASPHALRPILREYTPLFSELKPVELMEAAAKLALLRGRFRLIPYRALGGTGLLPAFRPEKLTINERENRELLVAISPQAQGEDFDAIL